LAEILFYSVELHIPISVNRPDRPTSAGTSVGTSAGTPASRSAGSRSSTWKYRKRCAKILCNDVGPVLLCIRILDNLTLWQMKNLWSLRDDTVLRAGDVLQRYFFLIILLLIWMILERIQQTIGFFFRTARQCNYLKLFLMRNHKYLFLMSIVLFNLVLKFY
jgi:hypothetical protein